MRKIEDIFDTFLERFAKKQKRRDEDEIEFWDRHWEKRIEYTRETGMPYELSDFWQQRIYERMHKLFSRVLSPLEGKHILEAGCGSGFSSIKLAQDGAKIHLLDESRMALEYAELIASMMGLEEIDIQEGDLFDMPFTDEVYDATWNSGVIEHYDDETAVDIIEEMARVTRAGGRVMLTVPNLFTPEIIYRMFKVGKGSERFYTKRKLRYVIEQSGLQNVQTYNLDCVIPSFVPKSLINFLSPFDRYFDPMGFLYIGSGDVPEK